MNASPYVYDATAENFPRLVLENSHRGPVLVHFWTPKAGPCMVLMPRLVKLASEYAGKFLLVMLNTDELGSIARQYGVNSVPTVKFFLQGEVVHTIHGAESDRSFRESLDRFMVLKSGTLYAQGLIAGHQGRFEEAKGLLAAAAVAEPDNPAIPRDLAKTLWSAGERQQALSLLESLPAALRSHPEVSHLYAHFSLVVAAENPPAELDAKQGASAETRFQQAAIALAHDEMEPALELLLKLDVDHPDFRNGLPRQALLALFDLLGPAHPLARKYRALLAQSLR
jgi:putative thioredoxin